MRNSKSQISIVGAGLVGSLLAATLGKRGHRVDVFERRPDPRIGLGDRGRSINLAVSNRGLHALREVGLEQEVLGQGIAMPGRMIHTVDNQEVFQPYGKDASQCIYSFSRGNLNRVLLDCAERSGDVAIHFGRRLTGADLVRQKLQFEDEEKTFSVAIGTDGSASALRAALVERSGLQEQETRLNYGYKELAIPGGPAGEFRMQKNALHIWPRGTFMLIALPNLDGSFTCTLFLPWEGPNSFAELKSPGDVDSFFEKYFPDVVDRLPHYRDEFFANPTGHMSTVKLAPWFDGGRALLLGDAAHAIVPFFGQGMNCGFEDVTVLDELLSAGGSWETVFPTLYERRKANTDAIADMAIENFLEMRDKVGDPQFLLERAVEKILEKQFPGKYFSRYGLVTFSRVPYAIARSAGVVTESILRELCRGLNQANDVDLSRAGKLIDEKLFPLLKNWSPGV